MQLLGSELKTLHNVNIENCPFNQRLEVKLKEAKRRVENGLVDEDDFDENRKGLKAQELYKVLISSQPKNEDLVFTHGDFCLPNIIIHKEQISGFIDLGRAGVADRYQDLALAIRSITSNFGREHVPFFLKGYGLKDIDETKVVYYQLLDEFF
ncbi:APH(3') family aminoglycoside O-phosphotransferase [Mesobacillus maritimus]|nr:APH(3') family aminoglycoside O-phosphotransferase [Mesobacillus maritimus]